MAFKDNFYIQQEFEHMIPHKIDFIVFEFNFQYLFQSNNKQGYVELEIM